VPRLGEKTLAFFPSGPTGYSTFQPYLLISVHCIYYAFGDFFHIAPDFGDILIDYPQRNSIYKHVQTDCRTMRNTHVWEQLVIERCRYAVVVPYENGTRVPTPRGFAGPVHVTAPIPVSHTHIYPRIIECHWCDCSSTNG
jgi:hypothetical protein